jgi:hypothetical protein
MESIDDIFGSMPFLEESSGVLHDGSGRGDKRVAVLKSVKHWPCGCLPEKSFDVREVLALETFASSFADYFLKDLASFHNFSPA